MYQLTETIEINRRLGKLYQTWLKKIKDTSTQEEQDILMKKHFSKPHLLCCTDGYIKSYQKIMLIGQEANDDSTIWDICSHYCEFSPENYTESLEQNEYMNNIRIGKAKGTYLLKTRFLLAGMEYTDLPEWRKWIKDIGNENQFRAILMNNLNKTSKEGKATPVKYRNGNKIGKSEPSLEQIEHLNKLFDIIYMPFIYDGFEGTIFQHELLILKPDIIIILGAKTYKDQINRDFNDWIDIESANNISKAKLVLNAKPIRIDDKDIRVVYAYHPSYVPKISLFPKYCEELIACLK